MNLPNLPYLIHLPPDYEKKPHENFPLILFLHGSGECGYGDEELPKVRHGNLASIADSPQGLPGGFPFIVVSPQCPVHSGWSPYELQRLMEEIDSKYRVDPDREYLTGLSLGGYGTWDTAIAFPHRWAAIAPMSGARRSERRRPHQRHPLLDLPRRQRSRHSGRRSRAHV